MSRSMINKAGDKGSGRNWSKLVYLSLTDWSHGADLLRVLFLQKAREMSDVRFATHQFCKPSFSKGGGKEGDPDQGAGVVQQ